MKPNISLLMLAAASLAPVGCLSGSGGEVVSRSAQDRPGWTRGEIDGESSSWVLASYKKADVFRLELGLRQAQAEALADTRRLLADRLRLELHKVASEVLGAGEAAAVKSALDNAVSARQASLEVPDARARNSYHEEIRKETDTGPRISYDVYVLVELPRQAFEEALHLIAKGLAQSSDARVKKIGKDIVAKLEGDASTNE